MKAKLFVTLGLFSLALAVTPSLPAQTTGGDSALSSVTYTWTNQTTALSSTALFTPANTGDYEITMYSTGDSGLNSANGGECPLLTWTDENGTYTYPNTGVVGVAAPYCIVSSTNSGNINPVSQVSFPIHVVASTTVYASTYYNNGGGSLEYNVVFSKVKLNP